MMTAAEVKDGGIPVDNIGEEDELLEKAKDEVGQTRSSLHSNFY